MASSSAAGAADLAGGDGEVRGLGDQSVRGGVNQPAAVVAGGGQEIKMPQEMASLMKLNKELIANMEGSRKDAVDTLKTQIEVKKMHLHQPVRLEDTAQLGQALLDKSIRMMQMAQLSSSSKMIDESLAEKSGVGMEVNKSKELEQEVAKLDAEIEGKMSKLSEMLEESLSHDLVSSALSKFVETNMELQDARKELIQIFRGMAFKHAVIGIKSMGELDEQPFKDACWRKHASDDEYESKYRAAVLISLWQDQIKNPSWHPFRIVEDASGKTKQVVDDDDAKLRGIRDEYGDDVCEAVKAAVTEMNEHNASGGYPVAELWNSSEGRKATVKEAVRELVKQLNPKKRRLN